MQRKQEVHKKFLRYSVPEKLVLAESVIDKLTNNSKFANPPFTLKSLSDATTALGNAAAAARSGSHVSQSALHDAEHDWDMAFNKAANFVNNMADGSQTVIEEGGFTATKGSAEDADLPDAPEDVDIYANRGSGSIHAECKSAGALMFYSVIAVPVGTTVEDVAGVIKTTPPANSTGGASYMAGGRSRKIDLRGLTPGQQVTIYMFISNSAGTGPLSHGVTLYVP